ncbi:MAG: PQQ-binding-like beta-propeller repeat protein [Acidobacteriota bacterium]|nr:PQQ-binding-like beta-propeller repeat protein [Acidobacteriota bacterium]
MHSLRPVTIFWLLLVPLVADAQPSARPWPQCGGPTRDFHIESVPLATTWPDAGPPELWRRSLGRGQSSIVAAHDTLVTMLRDGDDEVVIALDPTTGATRWRYVYPAPLARNGYVDIWLNAAGPGPYSTPLIAGPRVFTVGLDGQFHALDLETGQLHWSHDLVERFELDVYNAFASSPVAFGELVLLPLGGSERGVVAFAGDTGLVMWESVPFAVAPSSPMLIDVDGQTQVVVMGQQEVAGLHPADGRLLWRHPHPNELGLNLSMPVWGPNNDLFTSSGYDSGSRMIHLSQIDGRTTPEETWHTNRLRIHFSNALRIGPLILGSSGDFGPAFLTAIEAETGNERWRDRRFARAHMLYADDKLIISDEDGQLALASLTDEGLEVLAEAQLLEAIAWTAPTLVDGVLYARDHESIVALDLKR